MQAQVIRDERAIASEVGDDFVLVSGDMVFYSLNPTARFVWENLPVVADADALASRAVAEFNVTPQAARRGVLACLEELCSRGLAQPNIAPPEPNSPRPEPTAPVPELVEGPPPELTAPVPEPVEGPPPERPPVAELVEGRPWQDPTVTELGSAELVRASLPGFGADGQTAYQNADPGPS